MSLSKHWPSKWSSTNKTSHRAIHAIYWLFALNSSQLFELLRLQFIEIKHYRNNISWYRLKPNDKYVKSFEWLMLSSTFCTSAVPHSSRGISNALETSGECNSLLILCTHVARARSIQLQETWCQYSKMHHKYYHESWNFIKSFYCNVLFPSQDIQ